MTSFQWIALVSIVLGTWAGGYLPLFRREQARAVHGFPSGQAFTAGIFLALALTLMLPSAFGLLRKAFPGVDYPVASAIAIVAFLILLGLEHLIHHLKDDVNPDTVDLSPPVIPVIMTLMIAIPSFFLGTALGVSNTTQAVFIFIAIMAHKTSAAFALALKMVRSTMSRPQTFLVFSLFAFATPVGILVGSDIHRVMGGHAMLVVKGVILAMASGVFLYLGTLHEHRHTPLIRDCGCRKGFVLMLAGFVLTALVRWLIGEAHQ